MENSTRSSRMAIRLMIRQAFVVALVSLVSACVTTGGGNNNQVKKVVKQSCGPDAARTTAASNMTATDTDSSTTENPSTANNTNKAANPNNCLPKGVIEISENFGVDPEVRGEFNQAVMYLNQENGRFNVK